ncbi:MAG: RNA polymerase ECF-type sigma factor [uncultured Thermomicrobiales bacterium]|uniref:RNA polymerase ECF-type sigma factor n=1 Tax=uncultured Thermomicrobiales bacterium TaxID=1645740 RepID=A0A6J4VM56_9BACT|nr:MAG: RNA polymerase ECF-type sigma factor [uncultured Thermomicrobiales bacterium]
MDTARNLPRPTERGTAAPPGGWDPPDDALLGAIKDRDDGALAALYDRYGRPAYGLAYRILGERGAAEDAVQEAFLSVWRHAARFAPERGSARSWLMTIVHHAAIDRRRGRRGREQGDLPLDDVAFGLAGKGDDPFAVAAAGLDAERIRQAMAALPREQQRAIELAFFGGLTHQEVAERTGEPLGTVKGRMRLGLRKLRVLLEPAATAEARGDGNPRPAEGGATT